MFDMLHQYTNVLLALFKKNGGGGSDIGSPGILNQQNKQNG